MAAKIITISRQFGSGGRSIGKALADRLGIPFYDKELVEQVALESGFSPDFVEQTGEHSPTRSRLGYAFAHPGVPGVMKGMSTADFLWSVQCNVIMQLADKGPCVIVGRNADYILKDRDDVMDVYVHADTAFKAERIVRLYGESEVTPEKRLEEKDKRRRAYYKHYTGCDWGLSQNYHLSLDTGLVGIDRCAQLIADVARFPGEHKL